MYAWSSCLGSFTECQFALPCLHNCGVCLTSGLVYVNMTMCHITDLLLDGSLLALLFTIVHLLLCIKQYRSDHCLLLSPSIEFGQQSSHHTRAPASFANIALIGGSATKFSWELYVIMYNWLFVYGILQFVVIRDATIYESCHVEICHDMSYVTT